MPEISANLSMPYILPSQAQKHVTHNAALQRLDALVQLTVEERTLTVPPALPDEGARYIVATGASGAWAGQDGALAVYEGGGWTFVTPRPGWRAFDLGQEQSLIYLQNTWQILGPDMDNLPGVGINTSADGTNRLSVSAAATLLSHEGGGHQLKVNKALAGDTASLLFQTGWSGRAEMGTSGSDDFAVKVSADGTGWTTALSVAAATGLVTGAAVQASASDITVGRLARADYVFGPGNLLGPVSQSGGAPTGAVIERGSNVNGEYVRFADGTQICTQTFSGINISTSSGGLYKSASFAWTFPAPFTSSAWTGNGRIKNSSVGLAVHLGGEGSGTANAVVAWAASSTTGRTIEVCAIGRWF